ncbi:LPS export ABC transporter permease LptF [Silvimonas iriomotensis]|uniref:Lipopolysaccharide export system permease protein LptF n=1 Tax=Silvimonas iriomotensis TaxID=449662 RepID=A0ABQ2PC51_9NEIS|nr:LPS export ABC transporter permease LptF [Silvimonas iriomotensis]GGP22799.1 LPS export ABC transporter permease LptF [Silvimonas iriomotensis]
MLFRKTLIQEMTWVAMAVFAVLLLLVMTTQVVRLLGQAAIGALASSAVWAMMGFAAVRYLPILMSLMLFVSVLACMTRLWRENEMVIWFASGRSIRNFIAPVLEFSVPVVILIGVLSLVVSPWALKKGNEFREKSMSRQEVTQVAPGVFRESPSADRVYFVENFTNQTNAGNNVFVQMKKDKSISIIMAEKGGMFLDANGERWLWLGKGRSYQGEPGKIEYDSVTFDHAQLRIETSDRPATSPSTQATATLDLLGTDDAEKNAEIAWRLSLPVSALILTLAAIPLAFFNPRGGRALNLVVAVFLYFVYYSMVNIMQAWVADGKVPMWINMWPLHVFAAICVFGLYVWRSNSRSVS